MPCRNLDMRMRRMRLEPLGLIEIAGLVRPPDTTDNDAVGCEPLVGDKRRTHGIDEGESP
jgi:hypothetical protein